LVSSPFLRFLTSFVHGLIRGRCFSILLATVQSVAVAFQFFWPPFNPWTFLFVSFGHRLIRGRYFSFLFSTARSVAVAFLFFWPPFNPCSFLFLSFGHRLIRGRYFSFLLATARSVAVAFRFFWPRHCFVTVYSRNIASSVFFHKNFDFILFLKQKNFEYSY